MYVTTPKNLGLNKKTFFPSYELNDLICLSIAKEWVLHKLLFFTRTFNHYFLHANIQIL